MLVFLYNLSLAAYHAGIYVASLWNSKARRWVNGRKNILSKIDAAVSNDQRPAVWFHCASLGEFEQGRPLLEAIKKRYPGYKIVLTFFSPSGFDVRKNYQHADHVFYLPIDSKKNARKFIRSVDPSLAIIIKYEYWYHLLHECKNSNIPVLMVSAIFRNDQPFFKSYGALHKKMLRLITHFFVQDAHSASLLASLGINNVSVNGDTRFDRVSDIAATAFTNDVVQQFCNDETILVAGSTWQGDEALLTEAMKQIPAIKLIIAPHEINDATIARLKNNFPTAALLSEEKVSVSQRTLIIDRIGLLAFLYRYATFSYVGGGFNNGIHNVLEAAAYGRPVFFGPKHEKFIEAKGLVENGGGFSINNAAEITSIMKRMMSDDKVYSNHAGKAKEFVRDHTGATDKILQLIQMNRLLTN